MSPLDQVADPFILGAGMTERIEAHGWAATPLGLPESWPSSLRAVVAMMTSSRFAMWMGWGPDLAFLYNDAYAPTLGVKHGWALGRPAREVWAEIWPDVGPRVERVLATGEATWDEALLLFLERRGYPEETYHTFSYSPLRDDAGRIAGLMCVVTEETERVISERRLRTLRELGAGLAEAATEEQALLAVERSLGGNDHDLPFTLTYLWDETTPRDDKTASVALAAFTGFGASQQALLQRLRSDSGAAPWPDGPASPGVAVAGLASRLPGLPSGAWVRAIDGAFVVAIARPGQKRAAGFLVAGLNPHRPFDPSYADFVKLIAGQVASALANARAFEAERRRSEALAELDRAKTAFFSNVSHEFRTPLTLMLGPLQDGIDLAHGTAVQPLLKVAHRNAQRLLRLVNTLLEFSRTEAERTQALFRPTDLAGLTADLASSFRSAMDRAGLAFVVDCPALPEPVFVDAQMWEKIVLNLLSNALKFTFAGEVRVALHAEGTAAVLRVRDSGIGIPAAHLGRVFERFHRVEGSRGRSFEGSGIGLALVRDLVALHGGTVAVQSEIDCGSVFEVRIPLGLAHLPPDRIDSGAEEASVGALGTAFADEALTWLDDPGGGAIVATDTRSATPHAEPAPPASVGRVLLADDNADMRGYVRGLLQGAGHQVATVADGDAALTHLRDHGADLVLSDVMMPRLDGIGLLQAIRADPALRHVPVLLLSARAGEEARVQGLGYQADDYLVKPFVARELLARVGAHLGLARLRRQALDEQRELAARLSESEARFRMVGDTAPVLIWMADEHGQATWFNRPWLAFTGRSINEELGDGWTQGVHPNDVDGYVRDYGGHVQRRAAFRLDICLRRHDGQWRIHDNTGVPRFGPDGTFLGYIGSLVDVTDARAAATELRLLNETLEQRVAERTAERDRLWDLSEDLLLVTDRRGRLLRVSPSWTRLLGHDEAYLRSVDFDKLVHPDDVPVVEAALREMEQTGAPRRLEDRLVTVDGSYRWIAWMISPETNGPNLFGVGRDITAERAARDALLAQIEERERIEATLRQMQRLEAVGQLTSGVAHDFNNLLTVILGNVEFVGRGVSDPKTLRRLDMMRAAARRGANLTGQLLAFSRKQHLDPKILDVNEVMGGMADLLRSSIGGTVRLDLVLGEDVWPAFADQTQLELVILNLAINARDAMPVGGALTIRTGRATLGAPQRPEEPGAGDYVSVAVTDGGTGMAPEVLERAFEPFFTTKEPGRGSGLGLPQVYGFAKQSGGGVRIQTQLGEGTTVQVFLPRARAERSPIAAETQPARPFRAASEGRRALLVDDDADVREVTRAMLQDLGIVVSEAGSGAAALKRMAEEAPYDLVMIDFAMPGMNGAELARQIEQRYPGVPIVLVTGYADPAALRATDEWPVIPKPFLPDRLAASLDAVLRRDKAGGANLQTCAREGSDGGRADHVQGPADRPPAL